MSLNYFIGWSIYLFLQNIQNMHIILLLVHNTTHVQVLMSEITSDSVCLVIFKVDDMRGGGITR